MSKPKNTKASVVQKKVKNPEQAETNHRHTAWQKARIVTEKGLTAAGVVAKKIGNLAHSTTERAKASIAIRNLHIALKKAYHDTGEKVQQLNDQNKLGVVKSLFSEELKRIDDLKKQVKKATQNIKKVSFSS